MASIIAFFAGLNKANRDLLPPRVAESVRDLIAGLENKLNFTQFNTYLASFQSHLEDFNNPHQVDASLFLEELIYNIYLEYVKIAVPAVDYATWRTQYLNTVDLLELIRRIVLNAYLYSDALDVQSTSLMRQGLEVDGKFVTVNGKIITIGAAGELVEGVGGKVNLPLTEDWGVLPVGQIGTVVSLPVWYHTRDGFLQELFNPAAFGTAAPVLDFTDKAVADGYYYTDAYPAGMAINSSGVSSGIPTAAFNGDISVTRLDDVGATETLIIPVKLQIEQTAIVSPDVVFGTNLPGDTKVFDRPPVYNASWYLPDPSLKATASGSTYLYDPIDLKIRQIEMALYVRLAMDDSNVNARSIFSLSDSTDTSTATATLTLSYAENGDTLDLVATYSRTGFTDQQKAVPCSYHAIMIVVSKGKICIYGYDATQVMNLLVTLDTTSVPLTTVLSYFKTAVPFQLSMGNDCIEEMTVYPIGNDDDPDTIALSLLSSQ